MSCTIVLPACNGTATVVKKRAASGEESRDRGYPGPFVTLPSVRRGEEHRRLIHGEGRSARTALPENEFGELAGFELSGRPSSIQLVMSALCSGYSRARCFSWSGRFCSGLSWRRPRRSCRRRRGRATPRTRVHELGSPDQKKLFATALKHLTAPRDSGKDEEGLAQLYNAMGYAYSPAGQARQRDRGVQRGD